MARIAVLGIGNVLMGDDAVGPHVLAVLEARYDLPEEVAVLEAGTPGLDLTVHLGGHETVILVDAIRSGAAPGEVRLLDKAALLGHAPLLAPGPHDPGVREALLTLEFSGQAPKEVRLVGVVAEGVEGAGLSGPVRAAVPQALAALLAELERAGAPAVPKAAPGRPHLWWEPAPEGRRIEVRGTVQGVGMRPFVHRVAVGEGLTGRVWNHSEGVTIEAFGAPAALEAFAARLEAERPPAARYESIEVRPLPFEDRPAFEIAKSAAGEKRRVVVPPDLATCPRCLAEILDPADRRHRYPFTNCTDCGPRFTLVEGVPYDRPATTMASFEMCPDCRREYEDPLDRRFHAQPNACPVCGPRVRLLGPDGTERIVDDALAAAAEALAAGRVVAVKGLGGFHLACDATRREAVRTLRARKHRDEKPFAVMVADLAAARALAEVGEAEATLLASVEAPIVLVRRRADSALAPEVAPDSPLVGLMLAYTPLHHLLLRDAGRPLVMTSGNLSDEPLAFENDEAVRRLSGLADLFLVHDRPIASRADDSVTRVVAGGPLPLRRSRGFVPRPVRLKAGFPRPILACGAHLKNTFCLGRGDEAVLGPHVGDLSNLAAYEAYEAAVARLEAFLRLRPEVLAHDLHPDYLSTRYAKARGARAGIPTVAVQHHHAHLAGLMAEHGLEGPVLGLAWDGTGLGPDGTAWGGELLLARYDGYERLATFRPLPLAGGEAAIREPWRLALALLDDAFDGDPPLERFPALGGAGDEAVAVVRRMIATGLNTVTAHGAGRFFDAYGALLTGRARASYEGQVALALDNLAAPGAHGSYPFEVEAGPPARLDLRPATRAVVDDVLSGVPAALVAARVHDTLAEGAARLVRDAARIHGRLPVLLSGGCFQNARLAEGILAILGGESAVYLHRRVPPGDGGLALGQAAVASASPVP